MSSSIVLERSRRKPLAAALATLFALGAPAAYATTFVSNCNDSGVGSLRAAVGLAAEGDTVDASSLTTGSPGCANSKITLTTGDIVVNRNSLTIKGPGAANLRVTAKYDNGMGTTHQYQNRIFTHNGTGTLRIEDLTLTKGYAVSAAGAARGGCVYSAAGVSLVGTNVTFCSTHTTTGTSRGGGVYTKGLLYTLQSTVSYNTANGGNGAGYGGGASTVGSFISKYSTFAFNSATNTAQTSGISGGVDVRGTLALVRNTTISSNVSELNIGGLTVSNSAAQASLINSTISGNSAPNNLVGGAALLANTVKVYNSTIAFNTAKMAAVTLSPGLTLQGLGTSPTAILESNIVATNTYGASNIGNDLSITGLSTTGHNNLVLASSASLPGDTIVGKCPLLGTLKNNGGLTLTHALFGHSPAIDTGNNTFGSTDDQRGSASINGVADYARVSGPPGGPAVADIGAFEVDRSEKIFDSAFEGCP